MAVKNKVVCFEDKHLYIDRFLNIHTYAYIINNLLLMFEYNINQP